MSIASKWLDLVVGLDLHMEMVPMPAPTPTPFPHPFVGVVYDPVGAIVEEVVAHVSGWFTDTPPDPGVVKICGNRATVTGDEVSMPVPHIFIPPGVSWAPVPRAPKPPIGLKGKLPIPDPPLPPPSDALLMFGSQFVKMMGANAVRMGETSLSCSDPVRMPTSFVMSTGMPALVTVGGPPGIDWQQVLMMAGMRGLRNSWTAGKLHGAIKKVVPEKFKRVRNICHKTGCFLTGHPVNVANGCVLTDGVDFELPGPLPVRFERNYNSNWFDRDSPIGFGWAHSLDQKVWIEEHCVAYQTADGREVEFNTRALPGGVMQKGDTLEDPVDRLVLRSHGQFRFTIEDAAGVVTEFAPIPGEAAHETDRGLARIVRQRTPGGHQVEYRYDAQARLGEVHDTGGRVVKLEHDVRGRLKRIWLPAASGEGHRQHAEYLYDDAGDLVEVRDAAGKPMCFGYDRHLLTSERDRNGLTFYFKYDGYGGFARCIETWGVDPASEDDAGLYHHLLDYNRKGRRTVVTNSHGHVTTYSYDPAFMVTSVVDAVGGETTYEYDYAHREVASVDPMGRRTEQTYDAHGNLVMVVAPGKRVSKVRYDDKHRPLQVIGPEGAEWTWRYDAMGRVVSRVDPAGHATHYRYEGKLLQQVIDAAGQPTTLAYNSAGGLAKATSPDGTVTQWKRDALGRVVERVDPGGNVQRRTYDALGRVTRVQEPDGNVRDLAYDAMGNVLRARDRVRDVSYTYCHLGKLASRTVGRATVRYRYDNESNLTAVVNERGLEHRFEHDPLGEVISEVGWDGLTTLYTRDALGRVTDVFREARGAPHPDRARAMAYDEAGDLVEVDVSDGPTMRYRYRKDGALMEAAADDLVVSFERDALGRITKESISGIEDAGSEDAEGDADWVASGYDHRGLRIALQSSRGAAADIVRDVMGSPTSVAYRDGAHTWSARFSRNAFGQEVDRTVGEGDAAVRSYWWRDALGRPTQHWVGAASAPEGEQPTSHRLRKYGWDPGDLLRTLEDDAVGQVAFEHDVRGFLHKAETTPLDGAAAQLEIRTPDEVGDLFRSLDRNDREYGSAGQVLKRSGPEGITTYRYDGDGNLDQRQDPDGGLWYFHWNAAGHMVAVDRPDGTALTFRYDAFGRRIEKNANGCITRWIWDGNLPLHEWTTQGEAPEPRRTPELAARKAGLLGARDTLRSLDDPEDTAWFEMLRARSAEDAIAAEVLREATGEPEPPAPDEDGLITWLFVPETFTPLCRVSEKRGAMSIFTDHLGTPLVLTDANGEAVWKGHTDTYGHCEVLEGDAALCPWRFPGQYADVELGLSYNRFRYYDATLGGYVSRDPIGLDGGLALHGYVSDPLAWIDPLGLAGKGGCGESASVAMSSGQKKLADSTGFYVDTGGTVRRAPAKYHVPRSTAERASDLGFDRRIPPQRAPFDSHGQPVFTDGRSYITPDVDGHRTTDGWKAFDRRGRRTGTHNSDLSERVGD